MKLKSKQRKRREAYVYEGTNYSSVNRGKIKMDKIPDKEKILSVT